ncbi:MAG: Rieske (2Fe-2S) protein [Bacteroidetes bacterium]|nr:Rieske (2Fe-2S) protein [Bacteroidota bacterium]MBX7046048.1 Rieske (2Fe-2S) protein [Ignavibacteria bacterium]
MEKEKTHECGSSRRDFLKKSLTGMVLGAAALSCVNVEKLLAAAETYPMAEGSAPKTFNLSDFPELGNKGGYAMVTSKVIVINKGGGKYTALDMTCTHKKQQVEFDGSKFICPGHGSEFDKSGKVTEGPATKNLKSYKVTYNKEENSITVNM